MLSERLLGIANLGAEWVLWLLFVLSFLAMAAVLDRVILFTRTREKMADLEPKLSSALADGNYGAALEVVGGDSLIRNVLRAGLALVHAGKRDPHVVEQAMLGAMARERARYEARLTPIGTIGSNAPFVGLFGTVLGIIQAFQQLGSGAAGDVAANQLVISAIGEALVATAIGILVAIPSVAAFNWAKTHISMRLKHAEALMRAVLQGLVPSTELRR